MGKGYKTLVFGALLAVAGFFQAVDWVQFVPEGYVGIAMAVVGAAVVWLRSVTTTSILHTQ